MTHEKIEQQMMPILWDLYNDHPAQKDLLVDGKSERFSPIRPIRATHLILFGIKGNPKINIIASGITLIGGVPAKLFAFPDGTSQKDLLDWQGPLPARCTLEFYKTMFPSDRLNITVLDGSVESAVIRGFGTMY